MCRLIARKKRCPCVKALMQGQIGLWWNWMCLNSRTTTVAMATISIIDKVQQNLKSMSTHKLLFF